MVLDQNYFDLSKIDFSSVHIVLPSIFSFSKRFRVYSKWHKLIINNFYNINFLTFNENLELLHPSRLQNKYLQSKTFSYPKSTALENVFIPIANAINQKNIVFGGVDHKDNGHFWDRLDYYQRIDGKPLSFGNIETENEILSNSKICKKIAEDLGFIISREVITILYFLNYILQMIHSFRRRRLDNFLNRINLLVKGNIIDIGGQRSCCRGMFNGFTNVSSRLVVNNNISTNPDILIDIEQYDLKKFGNYNSVICTEVLEYLKIQLIN